ncbi:precorrin-6A synthase (deacetylating) [Caldichromatium japonicum]|uniref:Precorrin-6A synthase (Deacetylating) n=1 Tax=Caldichromatium japonicum TaxID=2699430 RepID=A0A6G7VEG1_9GAMM|nr:precorrin-6A synthase (deacetylating) [Caldichromatium japonicum]QIK38275.1 precorrin-6A synthase (deacetylating) [Caldichromatium japonicum]
MKHLYLIGMGPGSPEYLTVQAIETLKRVDVFFLLEKEGRGKDKLLAMRQAILELYRPEGGYRLVIAPSPERQTLPGGYQETVRAWHENKLALFARLIADELQDSEQGGLLLWGDPSIYDQTVSLIAELAGRSGGKFDFTIIPGISAVQMLAARHRIPLNRVGEEILITTGRELARADPAQIHNAVVMLDGQCAFQHLRGQDLEIYWGGNLGCPDETLIAGPLDQVGDALIQTRDRLREAQGWIMDTYLLRRRKL